MTAVSERLGRLPGNSFAVTGRRVAELAADGSDVVNLCQGNPDLPTPAHVVEALREAVGDPRNHRYSPLGGLPELRQAVAGWYQRHHGVVLDPATEVAITCGTRTALMALAQCLVDPGQVVLVPDPAYPDYLSATAFAGGTAHTMPLDPSNGWLPDYTSVRRSGGAAARLMFLNYPNNPTSTLAPPGFLDDTVEFARRSGITVVSDFAYANLSLPPSGAPHSFLSRPGAREVGVECISLSKTYRMAGWRVGAVVGNRDVVAALNRMHEHWFVSVPPFIQLAAVAALDDGPGDEDTLRLYADRGALVATRLRAAGWRLADPQTVFAWVEIPSSPLAGSAGSAAFAADLLERAHVAVAPGSWFGERGDRHLRLSLLAPREQLETALDRMVAAR